VKSQLLFCAMVIMYNLGYGLEDDESSCVLLLTGTMHVTHTVRCA
jgi:hypothetical protein